MVQQALQAVASAELCEIMEIGAVTETGVLRQDAPGSLKGVLLMEQTPWLICFCLNEAIQHLKLKVGETALVTGILGSVLNAMSY